MKKFYLPICFVLCTLAAPVAAQIHLEGYRQADIAPQWLDGRWTAQWISVPGEPQNAYGIYHFRKTFELPRATGTVRRARLGRQPLQAVRQRRAGFGRPGPRRRIQLELRNSRSGPVAETRQKYAGSRRMELRGNETGRPGQLQPDRVDRTATQRPKRPSIRTTVGCAATTAPTNRTRRASTVIMPQDRASRSTRPPTPGAGKRPDSTTRHGTKRRPA